MHALCMQYVRSNAQTNTITLQVDWTKRLAIPTQGIMGHRRRSTQCSRAMGEGGRVQVGQEVEQAQLGTMEMPTRDAIYKDKEGRGGRTFS